MNFIFFTLILAVVDSSLGALQGTKILHAEDTLEKSHGKVIFASLVRI